MNYTSAYNYRNPLTVDYNYSDYGKAEIFSIRTDKKIYTDILTQVIYAKVINHSGKNQKMDLQLFFSDSNVEVIEYAEWEMFGTNVITNYETVLFEETILIDKTDLNGLNCVDVNYFEFDLTKCFQKVVKSKQIATGQHSEENWKWSSPKNKELKGNHSKVPISFTEKATYKNFEVKKNETNYFVIQFKSKIDSKGEFYICAGEKDCLDPWWNSNWLKKLVVPITNSTGATLTNHAVFIDLNSTTLSDATTFWANVNTDGNDLRPLNSSENTELDFRKIAWAYNSKATLLIEVNSLPVGTSNIYIYFNNAAAATSEDTLRDVLYLAYNTTSITGWTTYDLGGSSWFSDGNIFANISTTSSQYLYKQDQNHQNAGVIAYAATIKLGGGTAECNYRYSSGRPNIYDSPNYLDAKFYYGGDTVRIDSRFNGIYHMSTACTSITELAEHFTALIRGRDNLLRLFIDDTQCTTMTDSNIMDLNYFVFGHAGNDDCNVNDLYILKEANPQPVHAVITITPMPYSPDANILKIDNNIFSQNISSFSYTRDGNLTIDFNIMDPDNNTLLIDLNYSSTNTEGTGTIIINDMNTVNITCDDSDFSNSTKCSWDWNISSLASDGNYYLLIFASDGAQTDFNASSKTVMVDNTAPSTTADYNTTWQKTDANVTLSCTDANSGCSFTRYRLDTNNLSGTTYGAWQNYDTNIFRSTDGNWAIDFNSTDNAGNRETVRTIHVYVDKNGPEATNTTPSENTTQSTTTFNFVLTVVDNFSGLTTNCDYNAFANNSPISGQQNQTAAVTSGTCTANFSYGAGDNDVIDVNWSIKDTLENETRTKSYSITYEAAGGSSGGGGGGYSSPASLITADLVSATLSTNVVYVEAKTKQIFLTLTNKTTNPLPISLVIGKELQDYVHLTTNNSFMLKASEVKKISLDVWGDTNKLTTIDGNLILNVNYEQQKVFIPLKLTTSPTNFLLDILFLPLWGGITVGMAAFFLLSIVFLDAATKQ